MGFSPSIQISFQNNSLQKHITYTDGIGGRPRLFPPQWGCPAHVQESTGNPSWNWARQLHQGAVEFALQLDGLNSKGWPAPVMLKLQGGWTVGTRRLSVWNIPCKVCGMDRGRPGRPAQGWSQKRVNDFTQLSEMDIFLLVEPSNPNSHHLNLVIASAARRI